MNVRRGLESYTIFKVYTFWLFKVKSKTKTTETCFEEILDFYHCVDHCAAKDIFKVSMYIVTYLLLKERKFTTRISNWHVYYLSYQFSLSLFISACEVKSGQTGISRDLVL